MARMKELGIQLFNALADFYDQCLNLEDSIRQVVALYSASYDKKWLEEEVRAIAAHPESLGYSETYFDDLKKMKLESASAKSRRPQGFSQGG